MSVEDEFVLNPEIEVSKCKKKNIVTTRRSQRNDVPSAKNNNENDDDSDEEIGFYPCQLEDHFCMNNDVDDDSRVVEHDEVNEASIGDVQQNEHLVTGHNGSSIVEPDEVMQEVGSERSIGQG